MAVSKLNREDAQEWLESLKLVGEGWWRQVALADRAGAPKALGITRREFAQSIGQRMIDPRGAIIELHKEGHSYRAIADILGVGEEATVQRVLAEEGLIEWTPSVARKAIARGYDVPADAVGEDGEDDADQVGTEEDATKKLVAQIEALEVQIQGTEAKRKREVEKIRDRLNDALAKLTDAERKAREEAEKKLTEKERERARKEADAWAREQAEVVLAGFSNLIVSHIVSALSEAADDTRELIDKGGVSSRAIGQIETAHAGFLEELNVARMAVQVDNS